MKKKVIYNIILAVVLFIIAVLINYAIFLNDSHRVSPHNQNAKYMYQSAASYIITLQENTENEISFPDGVYTGSLYTEDSLAVRPECGTKEEFDSYMKFIAGGQSKNAGYYAVYVSGGSVVSAFWSKNSYVIIHSAQFAAIPPQQDTGCWRMTGAEPLVGGYPTALLTEHSIKYALPEPLDVTVYDMSGKYTGNTKDYTILSVISGSLPIYLMLWAAVFIKRGIMLLINGTDKKERKE